MKKKILIFNPIFLLSLFILFLNDFYLKQQYGNYLTGKLSDLAGLIVFPVFVVSILPLTKKWISILTGLIFIIWKTPIVTPLIDFINQNSIFTLQRIIDYSDYIALLILPVAHKIINVKTDRGISEYNFICHFGKISLTAVTFFAICATSMPPPVEIPKGTVYIGKEYTIKKSQKEIIKMIKSLGYNMDYYENLPDSTSDSKYRSIKIPYYQTDNVIIYDGDSNPIDTILSVKYYFHEINEKKTKVEIINVTLSEDGNIQNWQTLKYLRKQYKKALQKQIIENVK